MKILITGGCGYVGGYLTDVLINEGHDITVYDNLLYEDRFLKDVNFINGDIRDHEKLSNIINDYDVVVWLAAMVGDGACQVDPDLTEELNFNSVKWLVDNYKGKILFPSTCHDTHTKLLTKRGILEYDQILLNDEVLSVNVNTNKLEWKGIENIIIKDYDGELETIEGRRISCALTPDHNLLLKNKKCKNYYEKIGNLVKNKSYIEFLSKFNIVDSSDENEEFCFNDNICKDNVPDKILKSDLFYLSGLYIGDGHSGIYKHKRKNKTGLSRNEFLKRRDDNGKFLSGINIGEIKHTICHNYNNGFCLPEGDPARDKLINLLNKYNINYFSTPIRITISSKRLCNFFTQFGNSAHNKEIPRWMLDSGTIFLNKLFEGLIDSDGNHGSLNKTKEYVTVSEKLIPCMMELALKTNHGFSYSKTHSVSYIDGRKIDGSAFRISFATTNKKIQKNKIISKKYNGKVWCLTIKDNHNFFIVRNGKLNVFGNCSIYGVNNDLIDETAEPNPLSAYATTKLAAERYIVENSSNHLIFRLGTLYGLGDRHSRLRLDLVANILTKKAVEGEKLSVFGGSQWRPLLHVKDVAHAFVYGLKNDITGLFNLSEKNFNISHIAKVIGDIIPNTDVSYKEMKFEDLRNYRVDNSKILATGWKPTLQLEDGVRELKAVFEQKRVKNPSDPVYSNAAYVKKIHS